MVLPCGRESSRLSTKPIVSELDVNYVIWPLFCTLLHPVCPLDCVSSHAKLLQITTWENGLSASPLCCTFLFYGFSLWYIMTFLHFHKSNDFCVVHYQIWHFYPRNKLSQAYGLCLEHDHRLSAWHHEHKGICLVHYHTLSAWHMCHKSTSLQAKRLTLWRVKIPSL